MSTDGNGRTPAPAATATASRPSSSELTTALVHLYRAEASKAEASRRRLDTTTNWAVVTTAAAITFALGAADAQRHVVILLTSVLVTFFLVIEARRYRFYDIWQTRVRLLECDFFAPMLWAEGEHHHLDWRQWLAEDLRRPQYHISFPEALGWRLRRTYVWIYATLVITWAVKISIHPQTVGSVREFAARAALGPIPGWLVIAAGLVFHGALIGVALTTRSMRHASGEVMTAWETRTNIQASAPDAGATARPGE